jgi:hypothetical protein
MVAAAILSPKVVAGGYTAVLVLCPGIAAIPPAACGSDTSKLLACPCSLSTLVGRAKLFRRAGLLRSGPDPLGFEHVVWRDVELFEGCCARLC